MGVIVSKIKMRGHQIVIDNGIRYADDHSMVAGNPRGYCGHCKIKDTKEGYDGCVGSLEDVEYACCGHGDLSLAYIAFDSGIVVRGYDAIIMMNGGCRTDLSGVAV